jgi:hypothetical protein
MGGCYLCAFSIGHIHPEPILGFELPQPLGIGDVHASVLGPPLVEGGVAEAAFAAQLPDG